MDIKIDDDIAAKLRNLLDNEDDNAVVRLRETKVGDGCKARLVLRLSIDEREDDDVEFNVKSMPFVINEELADQYGENFTVTLNDQQAFEVKATR
ncbi:MAG: ErpA-related iron-sulfur cluster insertion protein [Desulfovibrio sp.]|nr:ErpA-related iron-sulfur cluster insertion protein [Desulfovibrio sp.]